MYMYNSERKYKKNSNSPGFTFMNIKATKWLPGQQFTLFVSHNYHRRNSIEKHDQKATVTTS